MSPERISKLMLKHGMPLDYVCRFPGNEEYISKLGSLEVAIYEESFRAGGTCSSFTASGDRFEGP